MSRIHQRISEKLKVREEQNNLRLLPEYDATLVDFYSNDYLGLAKNKDIAKEVESRISLLDTQNVNGSTGSRLLSGNSKYAIQLEEKLAHYFCVEKTLIFNSGYNANLSILSSISQKGDTIIYDELIHASLKDGARLSFADRYSFTHNSIDDLKRKIEKASGEIFVVVEGVYSMDGDTAPLLEISQLCNEKNAHLIVDEAHSIGVFGKGLVNQFNLESDVFATIYTFGKGLGVHGACIAAKEEVIDYLINFARPFIYTTALPIHSLVAIDVAFIYMRERPYLCEELKEKIFYFNQMIHCSSLRNKTIESESGIHVIKIDGNEAVLTCAEKVREAGYDVRAIKSPTVKEGQERIRICLHSYNSKEEIQGLVEALQLAAS